MIKILTVMNILVLIIALDFWVIGVKYHRIDKYDKKAIKYVLGGTRLTGLCIILSALLYFP